jgi:hypothetical protein
LILSQNIAERELFKPEFRFEAPGTAHDSFLRSWRRENFLLGGRGTHKSGYLVAKIATSAVVLNPGSVSYLTEQTANRLRDVLEPIVRNFINPEMYKFRSVGQEMDIVWFNGSVTRLRSRQAKRIHDDPPFRGPSAVTIGHDEIARDRNPIDQDRDPILISRAMLRGEDLRVRSLEYTTTPVRNWFYSHASKLGVVGARAVELDDAAAYYTSTQEIDPRLYSDLIAHYDDRFARQELLAEWVALEGRVWSGWMDWDGTNKTLWPYSNRHWHKYDPQLPTVWGVDLGGAESAWLACQSVPCVDSSGVRVCAGNVLVAVGESTPSQTGAWAALPAMLDRFGRPARVYIGADYRTPGTAGDTAELAFLQHGIRAEPITGWQSAKDIQGQHAASQLCNTAGERRFAVSTNLVSLQSRSSRGILAVMEGDVWPDSGSSSYFLKDKKSGVGLEDMRDAWLYLLVGLSPPKWAPHSKHAAS